MANIFGIEEEFINNCEDGIGQVFGYSKRKSRKPTPEEDNLEDYEMEESSEN